VTRRLAGCPGFCGSYFDRFYPAAFNNFAGRMDSAQNGNGSRNPVIVLDGDDGVSVLTMTPPAGSEVTLDAPGTTASSYYVAENPLW
jgi:hypothetical protein